MASTIPDEFVPLHVHYRRDRAIRTEDLLVAAAIIAALSDRPGRAHLRTLADRLDRCARVCWRQQHPEGDVL